MEPDTANQSISLEGTPKPRSFFRRLGGVYASPRETFMEIGRAPDIWLPFLVLVVISLLAGFYLSKTLDLETMAVAQLESAVQQGRITQEQADQQMAMTSKFAGVQLTVMSVIGSLFIAFIVAGYAKLFSIFSGGENKFRPLLSVTAYVLIAVSIVQSGLMILVLQLKGSEDVSGGNMGSVIASSLGAILTGILGEDALPKFILALANAVDVFGIWTIALLAIGYSAVSKKLKTGTAAIWLAIAYVIIIVVSTMVGSIFNPSGT